MAKRGKAGGLTADVSAGRAMDPVRPGTHAVRRGRKDPIIAEVGEARPSRPGPDVMPPASSPPNPPAEPPAQQQPEPPPPVAPPLDPWLFEVGWEVCWQLGGIYTVLRTKTEAMLARWGDRYTLIGPFNPTTAAAEFEPTPPTGVLAQLISRLAEQGLKVHHGQWLIAGRPRVLLIDHRSRYATLDTDKYLLWADHGISVPTSDGEVNDVVAFGFAVAQLFHELAQLAPRLPVLAHFHEWMAGVAVPRIAHLRIPVTTVFTTHATLLGRYLAGDNPYFYDHLPFFDGDTEAAKYNILARHQVEKAAAHASTVFTTVSPVTAFEAEKLLGRRPDEILPNGLDIRRFEAPHEFQHLHAEYKKQIHQFVMGHFFPSYSFDLDRTLYLFTAGRYEYRNKGIDLFIEALHRLNERLKRVPNPPTVVAFIVTRAAVRNINVDVLRSQMQFDELSNTVRRLQEQITTRILSSVVRGVMPTEAKLIDSDAQAMLKRAMAAWHTPRQPGIVTHDLADDAGDAVLRHLRHRHLFNAPGDPVKVVFHPEFVTATSPLISLDYEQFVRGCHMGVFPSYYEPWGYTPMECIALGLPAVTTDLSGFGAYVQQAMENPREKGVMVLNRRTQGFEGAIDDLVEHLLKFATLTRRQRIEMRNGIERIAERFSWDALARHYHDAHDRALRVGRLEVRIV
jgi:glycogen(starch) synthase